MLSIAYYAFYWNICCSLMDRMAIVSWNDQSTLRILFMLRKNETSVVKPTITTLKDTYSTCYGTYLSGMVLGNDLTILVVDQVFLTDY